jgi:hypothetical protein
MPAGKVLETFFMCKRSTQFVLDGGMNDDFFSFTMRSSYISRLMARRLRCLSEYYELCAGTSKFQLYNPAHRLALVWGATAWGSLRSNLVNLLILACGRNYWP